jgi:hypothetical protein
LLETGQPVDPNGAHFTNSPARSREGSEDSELYDYNLRAVNTSTDYNSNDSDDEPLEENGLAVEAGRDSLQSATPEAEEMGQLLVGRESAGVIVTDDSGEVILKEQKEKEEEEDTRTTFSSSD